MAPILRKPDCPVWCVLWGGHVKVCFFVDEAEQLQRPTVPPAFYFTDGLHLDQAVTVLCVQREGLREGRDEPAAHRTAAGTVTLAKAAPRYKVKEIVQERSEGGEGGGRLLLVVCEADGDLPEDCACLACTGATKWYCRDCYLGTPPTFAFNDTDTMSCKSCAKEKRECGSAHWIAPDDVPQTPLAAWDRKRAPKELQLVRWRWPRVEMLSLRTYGA